MGFFRRKPRDPAVSHIQVPPVVTRRIEITVERHWTETVVRGQTEAATEPVVLPAVLPAVVEEPVNEIEAKKDRTGNNKTGNGDTGSTKARQLQHPRRFNLGRYEMKTMQMFPGRSVAALLLAGSLPVFAVAQQAKPVESTGVSTVDATLAAYQQVPLAQVSAESMGAKAKVAKAKPVAAEEEETAAPSKPGREGIKVHGHWVLQVKNADGTLGERREFENSLITTFAGTGSNQATSSGSAFLVALLSGNITVGAPGIGFVQGAPTTDPSTYCAVPFYTAPTIGTGCFLYVTSNDLTRSYANLGKRNILDTQLGLGVSATYTPTASIVLSGNYIVPAALTSIAFVQSTFTGCIAPSFNMSNTTLGALQGSSGFSAADLAASNCNQAGVLATKSGGSIENVVIPALTSTAVPGGPLAVTPGSVVQVTFTLSFS